MLDLYSRGNKMNIKLIYANEDVPKNTDTVTIWYKEEAARFTGIYLPYAAVGFYENGKWFLYIGINNMFPVESKNVFAWASTILEGESEKDFDEFCKPSK